MTAVTALETELRPRVSGELLLPGDPGYDEARALYNGIHDRRPAVIVRAERNEDVAAAVAFARLHDLPLAIRGGGHGVAGFASCCHRAGVELGGPRRRGRH